MSEEKKECCCGCKKKAKRKALICRIFVCVVALIIVLIIGTLLFLGSVIKAGIQTVGSKVTKCNITVDSVYVSILRGKVKISNLVVGNPEGFKTDSAFKLGQIDVDMNPLSVVKGERTLINEIAIVNPEITYEVAPLKLMSNIGAIQKNVEEFLPAKDENKDEKKEKKEGRPVEISHVVISGGVIRLSATLAGGLAVPVPLPSIELNDIGKEKEVTPPEATAAVLNETCASIVTAATESATSVGDAAKSVGDAAKSASNAVLNVFGAGDKKEEKK